MQTNTYTHINTNIHITHTRAHTHTHMQTNTYTHINTHIHITHTRTSIHTHMYTHIHVYTHTHKHTHTTLYECPLESVQPVGTRGSVRGIAVREYFAKYFISPQGSVPFNLSGVNRTIFIYRNGNNNKTSLHRQY